MKKENKHIKAFRKGLVMGSLVNLGFQLLTVGPAGLVIGGIISAGVRWGAANVVIDAINEKITAAVDKMAVASTEAAAA